MGQIFLPLELAWDEQTVKHIVTTTLSLSLTHSFSLSLSLSLSFVTDRAISQSESLIS